MLCVLFMMSPSFLLYIHLISMAEKRKNIELKPIERVTVIWNEVNYWKYIQSTKAYLQCWVIVSIRHTFFNFLP